MLDLMCLHIPHYSLSSCGAISSTLIPPLSLLSLSMLLAQENSVQQSAVLDACSAAVNYLLKNSQELLLSLLGCFATEIRSKPEYQNLADLQTVVDCKANTDSMRLK